MSLLEKALNELFPSNDPLDAADFDPVSYINSIFPTEQSLIHIDSKKSELQQDSDRVSKELSEIVRSQAKLGEKTQNQLKSSYSTIQELQSRVNLMREKAETSEYMVEEICKDIRSLDTAKKNLTKTITSLKRLAMLSHAIDQISESTLSRDYRKVAALLNASNDLILQFADLKTSKMVFDLRKRREGLVKDLRMQLMEDFRDIKNTPPELLAEACRVVDELGMELRQEIINELTPGFLKSYDEVFMFGQMHSGLEYMDRRYAWLKRCFREYSQSYQNIFPDAWQVTALIAKHFCEKTRQHVNDQLEKHHIESTVMVAALKKTLQLEQEISKKFNTHHILTGKSISMQIGDSLGGYEEMMYTQEQVKLTPIPNFNGIISQVFENYMIKYVDLEEESLVKVLDSSMADDQVDETRIYPSSILLFTEIKNKFDTCTSFNTGKILNDLSQKFLEVLGYYNEKLAARLPKADKLSRLGDGDEVNIAFVINTAEYCRSTICEMETTIRAKLETLYDIECYKEKGLFAELAVKGVQALANLFELKIDPHFANMVKIDWNLEAVGDKSEYTARISDILLKFCKNIQNVLNEDYLINFFNKIAEMISSKFVGNIYKCKKIGEVGAQQMQMDCFELKNKLLNLNKPSSTFTIIVNRMFHKCENLIKVISSPAESISDTYNTLFENPNPADFEKILALLARRPELVDAKGKKLR